MRKFLIRIALTATIAGLGVVGVTAPAHAETAACVGLTALVKCELQQYNYYVGLYWSAPSAMKSRYQSLYRYHWDSYVRFSQQYAAQC